MQLVVRLAGQFTIIVLTLASASIGVYWSWISLPEAVDPSLSRAWERMGGMNPLLLVISALLAASALALLVIAIARVARDTASGWAHYSGAAAWACLSGSAAVIAFATPGLFVMAYVERVIPGFTFGELPDGLAAINVLRLVWGPSLVALGIVFFFARQAARKRAQEASVSGQPEMGGTGAPE